MSSATVVKKNGKRYVKVGKRRIKVAPDISERELIQWMIKHFKPKRKPKKAKVVDPFTVTQPKVTVFQSGTVAVNDANRASLREAKDKLEEMQKKLTTIEQQKTAPAIEEKEKEKKDDSDRLPRPSRIPVLSRSTSNPDKKYTEEDLRRERIKAQRDELERQKLLKRESAKEIKSEKQKAAAAAMELNKLERKRLEDENQRIKGIMEATFTAEIKKKGGSFNQLRKLASEKGINVGANPTEKQLVDALLGKRQNLLGEDEIGAAIDRQYNPDLEKIQAEILKLEQKDAEEAKIVQEGSGNIPDEGLSELDINKAMKDQKGWLGTIAADEIELLKPGKDKRVCWIMNTDPRGKAGTHWVAWFIDARPSGTHSVEYYDPLADPVPAAYLPGVKQIIKAVHGSDSYLKFRENKIADQKNTSNNCGPFCIRFLQARLAGESFAKATGWDSLGEKNIEIWKKHPKQQLWISAQTGEGLRDIFVAIRKGATKVYERIKATLSGPRGGAPPAVRGWLAKYGDVEIQQVWVCKKPIYSIIETLANWFSQNKLRENMDRLGYDRLMHLYMIVQLKNGPTVKIEKNHVVEIKNSGDLGQRHMSTGHPSTVNQMIKQAEAGHGEAVWKYHLVDANCQKFIMWCLGTHASAGVRDFVQQDVEESLKDMGLFKKIATVVTDAAGAADVAMNGAGLLRASHSGLDR